MNIEPYKLTHTPLVHIPVNGIELEGELTVPHGAKGLIIFAHGSGSSRRSPRNQEVARKLQRDSFATLLVDLLSEAEDQDAQNRFDIGLLTDRLVAITAWALRSGQAEYLPIGYFGASTGAAAALRAAARADGVVRAIVSRGGRVDLAEDVTDSLRVPTLLVVGQYDRGVLEANANAFLKLQGKKELAEIPRATHLFEEPGALERVAELASQWFKEYIGGQE